MKINNEERRMWIENDEGLYDWWRSSRQSMREFIKENKEEIDRAIRNVVEGEKPPHYLTYGSAFEWFTKFAQGNLESKNLITRVKNAVKSMLKPAQQNLDDVMPQLEKVENLFMQAKADLEQRRAQMREEILATKGLKEEDIKKAEAGYSQIARALEKLANESVKAGQLTGQVKLVLNDIFEKEAKKRTPPGSEEIPFEAGAEFEAKRYKIVARKPKVVMDYIKNIFEKPEDIGAFSERVREELETQAEQILGIKHNFGKIVEFLYKLPEIFTFLPGMPVYDEFLHPTAAVIEEDIKGAVEEYRQRLEEKQQELGTQASMSSIEKIAAEIVQLGPWMWIRKLQGYVKLFEEYNAALENILNVISEPIEEALPDIAASVKDVLLKMIDIADRFEEIGFDKVANAIDGMIDKIKK